MGEPTGGKPNSWGEVRVFKLSHCGVSVAYSTRFTERRVDIDPPSLIPNVVVVPSVEDRLAQRDPVLAWVLARH